MTPEERLTLAFCARHPVTVAQQLERRLPKEVAATLSLLPADVAAGVLRYLLADDAAAALMAVTPALATTVLLELPAAVRLAVLRQMPPDTRAPLLAGLEQTLGQGLSESLAFDEGTLGSLVDPLVFTAPRDWTVEQVLTRLKATSRQVMYYVYILEREGGLAGVVTLKQLLSVPPERSVSAIMNPEPRALPAESRDVAVREHPFWLDHSILPVVNQAGRFIGALRQRVLIAHTNPRGYSSNTPQLSEALIGLWELYARTGLGLMTNFADILRLGTDPGRDTQEGEA